METIEAPEGDAPTLERVQKIAAQRAPGGIEARALPWSSYFRILHRHAARLRVGRFFIAGDAAHIHSPFGGQGMNTGLHDIWNLVWKLDMFLHGRGNDQLLDSCSSERLPVIKSILGTTDFLTKAMGTPNKFSEALRDILIPMGSRLAPYQHAFVQRPSELGIAHSGRPIVDGPGKRYLDDSMLGGGIASRFLLVLGNDVELSTAEAARHLCEQLNDMVELRRASRPGVALIRPDGYMAYSGHNGDGIARLEDVLSVLERQTRPGITTPAQQR